MTKTKTRTSATPEMEVHPTAAVFPMMSPDELQELADDIAANGLQAPIVMKANVLIDGRNRLAACALAGVEPRMVEFNGNGDVDAYILGANINRRHMMRSQRAMAVATIYPETTEKGGRGKKGSATEQFQMHKGALSQARAVLRWAPELADGVLAGAGSLDDAYEEALRRRAQKDEPAARLDALKRTDGDLADQVIERGLAIKDAEAAAANRRESERLQRLGFYQTLRRLDEIAMSFAIKANRDVFADMLRAAPDEFGVDKAKTLLADAVEALAIFHKELKP